MRLTPITSEQDQWPFLSADRRRLWLLFALQLLILVGGGGWSFSLLASEHRSLDTVAIIDRVNPNNAPASSLSRLPSIGPARAHGIIRWRQSHPGRPFRRASDLQAIRGIGPKTVKKIEPYLVFDSNSARTPTVADESAAAVDRP